MLTKDILFGMNILTLVGLLMTGFGLTLRRTARAGLHLSAEMAGRYGAETSVPDWHARLVCGRCGGRRVDMVVTSAGNRSDV
jgi:hypothetical protein